MHSTVPDGKIILLDKAGKVKADEISPGEVHPGHRLSRSDKTFEFCWMYGSIALYVERSILPEAS